MLQKIDNALCVVFLISVVLMPASIVFFLWTTSFVAVQVLGTAGVIAFMALLGHGVIEKNQ